MDASQLQTTSPPQLPAKRVVRHTILFLAANPVGTDRLALDEEARAIQEELERTGHRDQFELVTRWAVEPLDLLRELRRLKPTVVHYSGNGRPPEFRKGGTGGCDTEAVATTPDDKCTGLVFHGLDGCSQLVPTSALDETFGAAGASVQVVVLSACFSETQASALTARVACVVGIGGAIRDTAARTFAIGFYGGLGDGESVGAAFRQGLAAMRLQGPMHDSRDGDVTSIALPRLVTRPDIDPNELFLLHRSARRARCSIVIKATLEEFDAIAIARLRDQLRMLSGDVSLEIIEVREGSVRLSVSLSSEAAARLRVQHGTGELAARVGFDVRSFQVDEVENTAENGTVEPSRNELWESSRARMLAIRARDSQRELAVASVGMSALCAPDSRSEHPRDSQNERVADFSGARLNGGDFSAVDLIGAKFFAADLVGTKLTRANLCLVNLECANLSRADLEGAILTRANLRMANLAGANLAGAILPGADLGGADLAGANLTEASLFEANLAGANLAGADLTRAHLDGARLQRANLEAANLTGTNLAGANLAGADLAGANLREADLDKANLDRANLYGARLDSAILYEANFAGANLAGASLERASLDRASLEGANLAGANLHGADLYGANLAGANFDGANLAEVNLAEASLEGANLAGANLAAANVAAATDSDTTVWPDGFDRHGLCADDTETGGTETGGGTGSESVA